MIYVRGAGSAIAQSLSELTTIREIGRDGLMPNDGHRYLFCNGLLRQCPIRMQTDSEISETFMVNAGQVIRECDRLLSVNPKARICVIGSEAAFTWSYDGAYAAAKAALHRYVETKELMPEQQLVCVAPSIVMHTGMTNARNDAGWAALEARKARHPKGRFLEPAEVARMIHFLLCVDEGYTTGVVIRMNGGEHRR